MKNLILVVLLASAFLATNSATAQTGKCEREIISKSSAVVATRGKDKHIKVGMVKGQRVFLKSGKIKSRGQMPKCLISMYNEIAQDVDVYVDSNYMGSLKGNQQGVIETLDGYEKVYCVSADKKMSWMQKGDCNCVYVFKLEQ
jgi:hypothetical protein